MANNKVRIPGLGSIYPRDDSGILWVQFTYQKKRYRMSSKTAKAAEAVDFLKAKITEMGTGEFRGNKEDRVTYEELRTLIEADYERKKRRSLKRLSGHFLHLDAFFGGRRANEITETLIDRFIVCRQKDGAADATTNRDLAILRRMFSLAVAKKILSKGHVPNIGQAMFASEDLPVRQNFVQPADFARIHAALPEHLKDPVLFLYRSTWRPHMMSALQWTHVKRDLGVIEVPGSMSKNKTAQGLPIVGVFAEIIDRAWNNRAIGCPFVFYRKVEPKDGSSREAIALPIRRFDKAWATACRASGLPARPTPKEKRDAAREHRILPAGTWLYDLKRSGLVAMRRAGVQEDTAMQFTGHKTRSIFSRYNIHENSDMLAALEKVDGFLSASENRKSKVSPLGRKRA